MIREGIIMFENKEYESSFKTFQTLHLKYPKNMIICCYLGLSAHQIQMNEICLKMVCKTITYVVKSGGKNTSMNVFLYRKSYPLYEELKG